jgi:hypothetical protein
VACTCSHCHIYSHSNWNTPQIVDVREPPQELLQCGRNLLLLDAVGGLQVRVTCT